MRKKSPCYNCKSRKINCHSYCTEYLSFKDDSEKINTSRREYKENVDIMWDSIKRSCLVLD